MIYECDEGWYPLIEEMLPKLTSNVMQIKEKFGTLRVYLDYYSEEDDEIIREYERKSATICEACGEPGELRNLSGWYKTLCEECYEEIK